MKNNNVATQGYFVKRLRDSGFIVLKMFDKFQYFDSRKWTVLVDPENSAVFITCYQNKNTKGEVFFEINDGGNKFPKNYNVKTRSMEIIMTLLIERGVSQKGKDCVFEKKS